MVRLPEGYCIDSTEVTRAQYRAWLETKPAPPRQEPVCERNRAFEPDESCMQRASCQTDCDLHPQVCVDWCDANAYCLAVGKRLCGKIGGGPNKLGEYAWTDPNLSEWFNACSAHDMQKYASGRTYEATTCNGPGYGQNGTLPVGSLKGCQPHIGGYEGVYDLSGNVEEWENSCENATCRVRGGDCCSVLDDARLACAMDFTAVGAQEGGVTEPHIGFRCCASL